MPNLPMPVRRAELTRQERRALIKHATAAQHDIRDLTEDALEAGGEIAACLESEVQARPFFARELADIASTGARGLKAELRNYVEGS
jgi:predicted lactoylglutathione lyase